MHVYDQTTGEVVIHGGRPLPRPSGTCAPCRLRENGCPKGTPERQKSLTERNWKAWFHYQECRAVGVFPDDAIVRRNAATIRAATDAAEGQQRAKQLGPIAALLRGST